MVVSAMGTLHATHKVSPNYYFNLYVTVLRCHCVRSFLYFLSINFFHGFSYYQIFVLFSSVIVRLGFFLLYITASISYENRLKSPWLGQLIGILVPK